MSPTPAVLRPLTLPALLHHVLTTQPTSARPTLLIVCSGEEAFVEQLAAQLQHARGHGDGDGDGDGADELQRLLAPSLHNLSTTRHVRLAFCPSVPALLAYLTAYGHTAAGAEERVVLVNALALHASTPSFSAQGLSRCFATAADTALRTGVQLHMVECEQRHHVYAARADEDAEPEQGLDASRRPGNTGDAWEQEVSILNVSARRFGSGSTERAWAGRTVKAKRIAGRWFHLDELDERPAHANHGDWTSERR
ncbi:hypothetical protein ACJQWK_08914 [Exserohilum turcicum]|uniref:Uncharacterized protein n=1 Tax=Exserohilum turcicum (strain 28A) TaxID=671987 RepID=R0K187_EXST2|nr:uncharacterized protein SETTUDRAFT_88420 [Exserohilum turcica Et28A]EOA86923.1 hypothetical protein SETTUDRAFT_88420 [Exserohilum turcica Et28A]